MSARFRRKQYRSGGHVPVTRDDRVTRARARPVPVPNPTSEQPRRSRARAHESIDWLQIVDELTPDLDVQLRGDALSAVQLLWAGSNSERSKRELPTRKQLLDKLRTRHADNPELSAKLQLDDNEGSIE